MTLLIDFIYIFLHILIFVRKMLYIWHRLASQVFQTVEVTYRWTLWFGCRVGWADIIRRYLTFIFCHQTWQFDKIQSEETATGASTLWWRFSRHALVRGHYCISSLTWASCVARSDWMAAKAWWRDEQKYDTHVWTEIVSISVWYIVTTHCFSV